MAVSDISTRSSQIWFIPPNEITILWLRENVVYWVLEFQDTTGNIWKNSFTKEPNNRTLYTLVLRSGICVWNIYHYTIINKYNNILKGQITEIEPGVLLGRSVETINAHKMLTAKHEQKRLLRVMITDERLKPRIVFAKHNVLGFSKHDDELLGATKKQCYPQSAKRLTASQEGMHYTELLYRTDNSTVDTMQIRMYKIYAALVLRDCASSRLENLHRFSNSRDNFRFNAIWHRRFLAALVLSWRPAQSDVTVTPSMTCIWIDYVGDKIKRLM